MWSIATATVSFPEVGLWLGIGLWTLLLGSVWGIALAALRGNSTQPQIRSSTKRQTTEYQKAA